MEGLAAVGQVLYLSTYGVVWGEGGGGQPACLLPTSLLPTTIHPSSPGPRPLLCRSQSPAYTSRVTTFLVHTHTHTHTHTHMESTAPFVGGGNVGDTFETRNPQRGVASRNRPRPACHRPCAPPRGPFHRENNRLTHVAISTHLHMAGYMVQVAFRLPERGRGFRYLQSAARPALHYHSTY
ncbi:hypothetical protein B0T24DRAFT_79498 [Lasiosphaeria ovina]|uniref:Uncharacterized protein n=1 Tax=Lasiosphaeria ovina TaxID=92902 RepID=A0AAE0NMI7_9PEZI|nr:hypothetical protein B0T24DRAFT_79498 [Lasiosphaeria ovina]